MSWFFLVFFFIFTCNSVSEGGHVSRKKQSAVVVVGTVYCDTCFQADFSKSSHFIAGATVAVECKDENSSSSFREEVKTNNHGEFKVDLPLEVSKHVKKIEGCTVKLVKSSEPYCAVASTASSSSIRLKSRKHGIHVFSAGFFTFKPLKQPSICNQKQVKTKGAPPQKKVRPADLDDAVPTPDPSLYPDQFLPPNPLQPPLLPPNPLQPPPLLPPVLPSPPPLIPNPFQPPPAPIIPNPFQPPPAPLIPNPFQPPPAPLIPNPFKPPPAPLIPNPFQPPPAPFFPPNPFRPPPAPPSPLFPFPPIPWLTPSPPPPPPPFFPFPLPPLPFPPIPPFPGIPPASTTPNKSSP